MTDIKRTLQDFLEASQAVTLEETIEVATTPPKRPIARRPRPVLVAAAAAAVVVLLVGGAGLLVAREAAPVVATQAPQPASTLRPATTQPVPSTTQPVPVATPVEVSGQWTLYSADHGLPIGEITSVAAGPEGTAWAAQTSSLYRLDGTQWSEVANIPGSGWQWMVATPEGGVAMSVSDGDRPHRVVRFEGNQWIEETGDILDISALVTGGAGPRILGYGLTGELVDVRITDGDVSVRSASRDVSSGVSASFMNISDTVDVDSEGNAWYGSVEGAWRFNGDSLELFEFGVHGDCCAPLAVDKLDNVWIQLDPHGDLGFDETEHARAPR